MQQDICSHYFINMKHHRTEENQQNRRFKKQNVLDKTSGKKSGKKIIKLVVYSNLFNHH